MKKKILLVTERRADYSKLKPILNEIKNSKKLDYYLIVTGSHLLKEHGKTINEIRKKKPTKIDGEIKQMFQEAFNSFGCVSICLLYFNFWISIIQKRF